MKVSRDIMMEKRLKKLQQLSERYYGKKDLLDTWEELSPDNMDYNYRNDLKRRVRGHKNDLMYRGADVE